jgi:hypothetical protein
MRLSTIGGLLTVGACVLGTVALHASDYVGVYAVIEKVVLEPSEAAPERIQIRGAFALSDGKRGSGYGEAQRGYLYYACAPAQLNTCRKEWADLQTVAGKNIGVGFGGRYVATGRIRKADEPPASPDVYPIERGITRLSADHESLPVIDRIKAALRPR